jgi:hypothetical protein
MIGKIRRAFWVTAYETSRSEFRIAVSQSSHIVPNGTASVPNRTSPNASPLGFPLPERMKRARVGLIRTNTAGQPISNPHATAGRSQIAGVPQKNGAWTAWVADSPAMTARPHHAGLIRYSAPTVRPTGMTHHSIAGIAVKGTNSQSMIGG